MDTPIYDFVQSYINKDSVRLHMPGHKGKSSLIGCEKYDITEIFGADSLYEADGIICESENNASKLFGCETYYSTEGSSHCIRAMLFLLTLYAKEKGRSPFVLATRNVHKAFLSAVALMDISVEWIYSSDDSYLSCDIDAIELDRIIGQMDEKPIAVYLTSPDYLGHMLDLKALSNVCHRYGVLLIVDNAHGAYLKFLNKSLHPIDCGADMCCDSAHKTLPVLTGGAYLHLSDEMFVSVRGRIKDALSLFGSTSPSYLVLQSLDLANRYISDEYRGNLVKLVSRIATLKHKLSGLGINILKTEPLKLTLSTKSYGYYGNEFAEILRGNNIESEFADNDFVVLMFTPEISDEDFDVIESTLTSVLRCGLIESEYPKLVISDKDMTVRDAIFSLSEVICVDDAEGRVLATPCVSCPPAVPVLMPGEIITSDDIIAFKYYGINRITVVKS